MYIMYTAYYIAQRGLDIVISPPTPDRKNTETYSYHLNLCKQLLHTHRKYVHVCKQEQYMHHMSVYMSYT